MEFAAADALSASPVSLRAALDAATLADDAILGVELVERAERVASPPAPLASALATARARFAHRTGRIAVHCPGGVPCLATVDGAALDASLARIVAPGVHTVTVQTTGPVEARLVDVPADQTVGVSATVGAAPPLPSGEPAPAPAPATAATGLSPAWFVSSAVATAVAAGLSIGSGIDTDDQHGRFVDAGCPLGKAPSCSALAGDGVSAQTRTNVLLAVTAGLAATTAALGFLTRWHGSAAVAADAHTAYLTVGAGF